MVEGSNDTTPAVEAERRKLVALDAMETRRDLLILRARRAMLRLLLAGAQVVTFDDVRDAVDSSSDVDGRFLGAVPRLLARAGVIIKNGYVESRRAKSHAQPIALWMIRDRAAAEQWLHDHPDPTEPPPVAAGPFQQGSLF